MSRHRIVLRDNLQGITRPALRRVMRKAGIKRASSMTYETARYTLKAFMEKLIHDAVMYTEYAHRKTVTVRDVIAGAKRNHITLYTYDYENGPIDYRASADYNELVSDEPEVKPEVASVATPIGSADNAGLPIDDYMNTAEAAVSIPPSSILTSGRAHRGLHADAVRCAHERCTRQRRFVSTWRSFASLQTWKTLK